MRVKYGPTMLTHRPALLLGNLKMIINPVTCSYTLYCIGVVALLELNFVSVIESDHMTNVFKGLLTAVSLVS